MADKETLELEVDNLRLHGQICQRCLQPFFCRTTELYEGLCHNCAQWEQEAFFLDWNYSSNYVM